jgi:hypothetical protein
MSGLADIIAGTAALTSGLRAPGFGRRAPMPSGSRLTGRIGMVAMYSWKADGVNPTWRGRPATAIVRLTRAPLLCTSPVSVAANR